MVNSIFHNSSLIYSKTYSFLRQNLLFPETLNSVQYFLGTLLKINGPLKSYNKNNDLVCKLKVFGTMPKRVKSNKSLSTNKKSRKSVNCSQRTSIPRNCKNNITEKSHKDQPFVSLNKHMTTKVKEDVKNSKEEKDEDSDGLDVVFDVQEEKKNKIYEVITVMSDDETPNTISYERIYAEDPEKRVVDASEIPSNMNGNSVINFIGKTNGNITSSSTDKSDPLNVTQIVSEVVKEANLINKNPVGTNNVNKGSVVSADEGPSISVNLNDSKSDSDSDIVCVAVIDAKTKEEQKKAKIEEICLSSDSESEWSPTVPPLKIKLPVPRPYFRYLERKRNLPYGTSTFSYPQIYPYAFPSLDSFADVDSHSSSPKISSDDASNSPTTSQKVVSDSSGSSTAVSEEVSQGKSYNSDTDSSSSSSSSEDNEEKKIYWKANREMRRKLELRYEEFTDLGKDIRNGKIDIDPETSYTFKVMSYNVLAQYLLEEHRHLYKNNDRRALGWARRWDLLYKEIKDENPEILCLQEVEHGHLVMYYAKLMDLGYRWVFKKRTSNKNDGVAIFYKTDVFEIVAQSTVEYYQPGVSVLDRDNVGVVLRLRLKNSPSSSIVVATTHLLYNPKRGDVKLAQAQVLLAEIDRLAYNKDALTYHPIILTGDFNLPPHHGVYKLIVEGHLNYEGMSRKSLLNPDDFNLLPKKLLPSRLGITDHCQHSNVVEARVRGKDSDKIKLYHSENNREPQGESDENDNEEKDDRFESGSLYHSFNFHSVYNHYKSGNEAEATTHHEKWITVDYIFYSVPKVKDGQKKDEGPLQLISRLRLPSHNECSSFIRHLPNFAFGSDHLPLVGKFLLRLRSNFP